MNQINELEKKKIKRLKQGIKDQFAKYGTHLEFDEQIWKTIMNTLNIMNSSKKVQMISPQIPIYRIFRFAIQTKIRFTRTHDVNKISI